MNTNRLPSGTACHYIGGREGLAEALRRFTSAPLQIIDLVGSFAPTLPQVTAAASASRESVIISTRRNNLNDELGHAESSLLAAVPNSIILRCAPLDLSIPLLWAWAQATGILMSAFHTQGVAWIRTVDLAEAISRMTAADIGTPAPIASLWPSCATSWPTSLVRTFSSLACHRMCSQKSYSPTGCPMTWRGG